MEFKCIIEVRARVQADDLIAAGNVCDEIAGEISNEVANGSLTGLIYETAVGKIEPLPEAKRLGADVLIDIVENFIGKHWCFNASVQPNGIGLGIVVSNEPGYTPVPLTHYQVADYNLAADEAERLNSERHIGDHEAMRIVSSSIAASNARKGGEVE